MKERKRVVIIGAAPRKSYIIDENAIIVTANGAASIGNEYKSRFNNYVINIVGSGRLKEDLNVRNIISSSSADVLVVLGEKMSKNDIFFKQCKHKQIIFLSYKERFNLMRKTIGLFPALKSGVYEKNIKMFKKILISEILYPFQF